MFGFLKRKDKGNDETALAGDDEGWGKPTRRKMSRDEAARDAAEQKLIEEKNQERRDTYRLPGIERIFLDNEGRRLALRTEDNTGPQPNPHHPPLLVVAFWGVKEVGRAEMNLEADGSLRQTVARIEHGFEGRGIGAEILREIESLARAKGGRAIYCTGQSDNEWNAQFLAEAGFSGQADQSLVKTLS